MKQKAFNKHWDFNKEKILCKSIAFYNVDVMLMGEYFPGVIFFNFKTKKNDMLRLEKGLLHGYFPFRSTFIAKEGAQL